MRKQSGRRHQQGTAGVMWTRRKINHIQYTGFATELPGELAINTEARLLNPGACIKEELTGSWYLLLWVSLGISGYPDGGYLQTSLRENLAYNVIPKDDRAGETGHTCRRTK